MYGPSIGGALLRTLLLLGISGLTGCGALSGGGRPRARPLTPAQRLAVFESVWSTVDEAYPDPSFNGVDWRGLHDRCRPRVEAAAGDKDFYEVLQEMLTQLHDSHTHFDRPLLPDETPLAHHVGLTLRDLDGQYVVTGVASASPAQAAGIQPGMVVRTVDSRPAQEQYRRLEQLLRKGVSVSSERAFRYTVLRAFFLGPADLPAEVELVDADGTPTVVRLARGKEPPPSMVWRRLPSGAGYVRLSLFLPPNEERFKAALEKLTGAPALLIDLRGTNGGRKEEILAIAGHFFTAGTDLGADVPRSGPAQGFPVIDTTPRWRKPTALLVDEGTASAAEVFTAFMRERAGAVVVGQPTSGAAQRAKSKRCDGGGTLVYSAYRYRSPGGRAMEGAGVVPDIPVEATLDDVRRQRDAAIEAAERALQAK